MLDGALNFLKSTLGRDRPGRSAAVRPDDVFIVSYPRSGNTWMRFLVGNLVYPEEPITFSNLEQKVPDIYQNSEWFLTRMPDPRVLKSHEVLDPRYGAVIYLVRDPREVCVSYYHYHLKYRKIEDGYPIDEFTQRFVSGDLDPHGPWGDHVGSWLEAELGPERFKLIRYEDLAAKTYSTTVEVALFLGIGASPTRLQTIIEQSSFSSLHALETQQAHLWKMTKRSRKDIPFIRAGQIESWKDQLPIDSAKLIEAEWPQQMRQLGYLPSSRE